MPETRTLHYMKVAPDKLARLIGMTRWPDPVPVFHFVSLDGRRYHDWPHRPASAREYRELWAYVHEDLMSSIAWGGDLLERAAISGPEVIEIDP